MQYILDILIVLIVLICIFLSAKRGFMRTLIEVVGFIAAIFIAFTVSSPIANTVYDKMIEPSIVKTVESTASENAATATNIVDNVWDKLPGLITKNSLINISKDAVTQKVETDAIENSTVLANTISESFIKPSAVKILSTLISTILVVVLIFAVKILAKYINKLFNFSVIGSINKFLGGILGLVKGIAISIIFCMIITLIISVTKNGFLIFNYENINNSYVFKYIAEFSPFFNI